MAKAARKPAKRKSAAAREQEAAIEAQALEMATAPDPQTGQAIVSGDMPNPKAVKAAREAAQAEQFGAADDKAREAIEQATLSRAVRGY